MLSKPDSISLLNEKVTANLNQNNYFDLSNIIIDLVKTVLLMPIKFSVIVLYGNNLNCCQVPKTASRYF